MSNSSTEVFVDLPVLIDYCRTHAEDCYPTRKLLDIADQKNAYIAISSRVYDFWEESVLNMQALLKYLKSEADRYVLEENYNDTEQKFSEKILCLENLNSENSINHQINQEYSKTIDEHIEYIDQNGLTDYRGYLDTHLENCSLAHNKMDGMIDNRYGSAGADRFWIKNTLESFSEYETHLKSLVDGHYWCKSGGDLFLVRNEYRASYDISELKKKLVGGLDNSGLGMNITVACPDHVLNSIE